jgi:FKBP-type peptidyl-prolyl cis-trans isomerase
MIARYTGWLRTPGKPEEKGKQFDSTQGRGPFQTAIGVGRVIKGEFALPLHPYPCARS